jgi:hypothetical protein
MTHNKRTGEEGSSETFSPTLHEGSHVYWMEMWVCGLTWDEAVADWDEEHSTGDGSVERQQSRG